MLAVEIPVIAREDDDGVVEHAFFLERREDAAETVVNTQQHLDTPSDFLVGRCGLASEWRQPLGGTEQRGFSQRRFERTRASRHRAAGVASAVAFGGHEPSGLTGNRREAPIVSLNHVRMDRLVCQVDEERLFGRTLNEPLHVVGEEIGRVTFGMNALAVDVQRRVDGFALTGHGHPVIETGPRAVVVAHVPLAEERRPITRALEFRRKRR